MNVTTVGSGSDSFWCLRGDNHERGEVTGSDTLLMASYKDYCPYCGERIELLLDPSQVGETYIEDCEVCCRPIRVTVSNDSAVLGPDSWAQLADNALDFDEADGLRARLQREDEV